MNTHARRWLAATAVVATALTLAACDGSGEDPPTTPTTETTTEPSDDVTTDGPSATAMPPELEEPSAPPEMQQDDTVGASAAVWYFLELYDYMRATGETAVWESMSSPECEWCAGVLDGTTELHAGGGWVESSGLTFDITTAEIELPGKDQPFYVVRLAVVQEPYVVVNGDGTTTDGSGETLDPMSVAVQYTGDRFLVVGVNYAQA